jgi:hypothetical protein
MLLMSEAAMISAPQILHLIIPFQHVEGSLCGQIPVAF